MILLGYGAREVTDPPALVLSSCFHQPQIYFSPQQRKVLAHDVTKSLAMVRSIYTHRCTFWSLVTDLRDKKSKLTVYTLQTQWQKTLFFFP